MSAELPGTISIYLYLCVQAATELQAETPAVAAPTKAPTPVTAPEKDPSPTAPEQLPAEVCNGTDALQNTTDAASTDSVENVDSAATQSSTVDEGTAAAVSSAEEAVLQATGTVTPTMDDVTEYHRPKEAFEEYRRGKDDSENETKESSDYQQNPTEDLPECDAPKESGETNGAAAATADEAQQAPVVLKYTYKEDQWSPLNPEGKKLYDRNFLLTLQWENESTKKPEGLTHLPDIVLDAVSIPFLC